MTAKNTPPKSPVAARSFRDANTGRTFVGGKPIEDVQPAFLENFRAAGLVRPDRMDPAQQIIADAQDAG